jgi:hypothetical protein
MESQSPAERRFGCGLADRPVKQPLLKESVRSRFPGKVGVGLDKF